MSNPYYNHTNPFMPGTVPTVQAQNDQFDAVETGFDLITHDLQVGMANNPQITQILGRLTHLDNEYNTLALRLTTELQRVDNRHTSADAVQQAINDLTLKFEASWTGDKTLLTSEIHPEAALVFDHTRNLTTRPLPNIQLPKDFEKGYLGIFSVPPTTDNQGNPIELGALYYDNSTDKLMIWRQDPFDPSIREWTPGFISGAGVVYVQDNEPSKPSNGDLWFDPETGDLAIHYYDTTSRQWVVINSGGATVGGVVFSGTIDVTQPMTIPSPTLGQMYLVAAAGQADPSWPGLGLASVDPGDTIIFDGVNWDLISSRGALAHYMPLAGGSFMPGASVRMVPNVPGATIFDGSDGALINTMIDGGTF